MNYKSLYREFRPKTFNDVVGQRDIVEVLKRQIKSERISHAYLFTGSRGTGKTSVAKILARAICCSNTKDGEACMECKVCQDSLNDVCMDIIEIDAASHNGVDEIRELNESAKYGPISAKYKVYIIDEVHMLSGDAFNAFLKTLEEPPKNIVFILATTEPQKLLETIISRCQQYEFELIGKDDIVGRLEFICKSVEAQYEIDALYIIAEAAKGGLRDAIKWLEQCLAFTDGKVEAKSVLKLLGKSSYETLFEIGDLLYDKNSGELIRLIGELSGKGQDITVLTGDIIEHLHKLLVFKTVSNPDKVERTTANKEYERQSKKMDISFLTRGIKMLSETKSSMRYSFSPMILLETCILELCTPQANSDNLALIERINELENKLATLEQTGVCVAPTQAVAETSVAQEDESNVPWDVEDYAYAEEDEAYIDEEYITEDEQVNETEQEQPKEPVKPKEPKAKEQTAEKNSAKQSDKKGADFTKDDYDSLLTEMKSFNKSVSVTLRNSFFGGVEDGTLIIGFDDNDILVKATNRKADVIEKLLNKMGFMDLKVCAKILKQDKTEDLKKFFGDEVTIQD